MIYLDNASTTQPAKEVLDIYQEAQKTLFYNSESLHAGGEMVREALNSSRKFIQAHFNTKKKVIFTTSGSQANQIAISTYLQQAPEGRVIVSPYEHPSVAAALEPYRKQFEIIEMPLDEKGEIDLYRLKSMITEETVLLIAQHVSSETGYILPVNEIAVIGEKQNIPIHVDGVQAVHKISDVQIDNFTSYSFSGHKFNGTKGSGTLLIEHKSVRPINIHYFHEEGTRNGTLDVPSILAMAKALSLKPNYERITNVYKYALKKAEEIGFIILDYSHKAPHILGLLTPFYEGQYIMQTLSSRNICISTGTACGHGLLLSDGLLEKIDSTNREADQYIRISFSKNTTINEVNQCFDLIETILKEGALYESS